MTDVDPFGHPIPDTGIRPERRESLYPPEPTGGPEDRIVPMLGGESPGRGDGMNDSRPRAGHGAPGNPGGPAAPAGPADSAAPAADAASGPIDPKELEERVIEVLKQTYDPEIPVNIYDLGMIYTVEARPSGQVNVRMTLTSPMCPVAGTLPGEVETRIRSLSGVTGANVELVWDPPWDKEMISEAGKLVLNIF